MTTKQDIIEMIEKMPEDSSPEDIMYEIYVRQQVDQGLEDIAAGRTVSHDEVMRNLEEWLQSAGQ